MGGASVPDSGGGKHRLDFEINLVPMIDLLSCCISFLIITAAWTQLARLETSQKLEGAGGGGGGEQEDKLQLVVFDWGYELLRPGETESCAIRKNGEKYDRASLRKEIVAMKVERPKLSIAAVAADDKLDFIEVVGVMDTLVDSGLVNISLGQVPGFRGQPKPCGGG